MIDYCEGILMASVLLPRLFGFCLCVSLVLYRALGVAAPGVSRDLTMRLNIL